MIQGRVYIVGAGPGDPGLITAKGMECLRQAEVVVYDRLVDESLLELVPPGAELIYVGKSSRVHAKEQNEINHILVDRAKQGQVVVRLKGGDPFVLGRGGEEAEELVAGGVPYEIVPGISSAVASPAYAGIPVTHRHLSSSFAVITGHEDPTKEISSIKWDKLATGVDTLVFLMGMGHLPLIADKLIECGRSPDTPVALIRQGTTLEQRVLTAVLADVAEKAEEAGFEPPVTIVVGEVVRLRETIRWFEERPLFGKRVLVTRARTQASVLSRLLAERGARPIELPAIEILPLPDPAEIDRVLTDLSRFDWVIFTSANGVESVWERLMVLGGDARRFASNRIVAIGPATSRALEERGLYPDFMPTEYTSEGIVSGLKERGIGGQRMLLPRADIAPGDLVEGLVQLGAEPVAVTAYLTRAPSELMEKARKMLREGEIDVITFTSSSTVSNLINALGENWQVAPGVKVACIGPVTAATAEAAGLGVDIVAGEQTIPGLVKAIEEAYQDD